MHQLKDFPKRWRRFSPRFFSSTFTKSPKTPPACQPSCFYPPTPRPSPSGTTTAIQPYPPSWATTDHPETMSTTPMLLSRRSAGMLHLKPSHIYRPIQARATYGSESAPRQKTTENERPALAPRPVPIPNQQLEADSPPTTAKYRMASRPKPPPVNRTGIENTPEYKTAARKWISAIIAMPIFIVTSYLLFNRCTPPFKTPIMSRR